jgi:single-stranded-DNA-specific exonuclease
MAAGLSLEKNNLPAFRRGLGKAIERQLGGIILEEPTLQIDAWLALDEISLSLADAIEMLAPFGAGNPELTLATRGVRLKSVSEIGKTKEHLRLVVEDEQGKTQSVLWWGGAGSELPPQEGTFDIAYSLRSSTFRGEKQVNLQFEEFRAVEEKPIEIQKPKLEVRDMRLQPSLLNLQSSTLIWAEGADKARGRSRFYLTPAAELVIYTTPPSPAVLRAVLDVVKPQKVHVLGIPPAPQKTDEFLSQLAGMAKFVINNKQGKVLVGELAGAMGQRESAVRIGLEWLAAGGHVAISGEEDALALSRGSGEANQYVQKELYVAVKGILEETKAYRDYFARADLDAIFR